MINWESLIASKMRPCATMCKIEDAGKRNQAIQGKKWRKNDPKRKAWQKAYDQSPQRMLYHEQYRKENRDDINARHRARNATPEGKRKNSEYNAMWRKKNKEYDRKRKQEWWRRTHPNPKPIGRPKKEAA